MSAAALVLAAAGVLAGPVVGAFAGTSMDPAARRTYVVRSGDTLWAIATAVAPGQDPRVTVDSIEAANHVDAGTLRPGQTLVVPAGR
jgi:Tfp pilus assembly protein FimV